MFCRSLFVLFSVFIWPLFCLSFFDLRDHIGGVMISVLSPSVVDHGFGSQLGETIKCVFLASLLSTQHYGERAKSDWLEISIMCQSGTVVSVS
jgi:hypothetical protein